MTGPKLDTSVPEISLVPIDSERDAANGQRWLAGDSGRQTLQLMGVTPQNIHETTLADERERLEKITNDPNELAWMIKLENKIVGILEVKTQDSEYIKAPNVSIMIDDPLVRGRGIGLASLNTAAEYLFSNGYTTIYARHLSDNEASAQLLSKCGFKQDGDLYKDADGLEWQNLLKNKVET